MANSRSGPHCSATLHSFTLSTDCQAGWAGLPRRLQGRLPAEVVAAQESTRLCRVHPTSLLRTCRSHVLHKPEALRMPTWKTPPAPPPAPEVAVLLKPILESSVPGTGPIVEYPPSG
jgi:hypothetical protein